MRKRIKFISILIAAVLLFSLIAGGCGPTPPPAPVFIYNGSTLENGTVGVAYSQSVASATGAESVAYELKSGSNLPLGLTLTGGIVSGTPTTAVSDKKFTVVASSEGITSVEAEFSITIEAGIFSYTGSVLSAAKVGDFYSASVAGALGAAGITYTLKQGNTLPAGLAFNNGTISGTPTVKTTAPHKFITVASAANYKSVEAEFSINVDAGTLSYSTGNLSSGRVGVSYSASVANISDMNGVTYDLKQGNTLPAGLSFNNGTISGTPTAVTGGAKSFTVIAGAENYDSAEATFSIIINAGTLTYENGSYSATIGETYSQSVATAIASGTLTPVITYTLSEGTLPQGLSFNNGIISGEPGAVTSSPATIKVTASAGGYTSVTAEFKISVISEGQLGYNDVSFDAAVGIPFNRSIASATAAGGKNVTITYSLKDSILPSWLTLSNGILSGTPTAITPAPLTFKVVASAENFDPAEATFTLTVNKGSISFEPSSLNSGRVGIAYSSSVATATTVGVLTPIITYALKGDITLPAGLSFANGTISGVPTTATVGMFSFTVVASAGNYSDAEAAFVLVIQSGTLSYNVSVLQAGIVGSAYSVSVANATANGEITPVISYALKQSNPLPAGLSFNNGTISGTPTAKTASPVSFTVIASAANFTSVEVTFSISVVERVPKSYTFEAIFTDLDINEDGSGWSGDPGGGVNLIGVTDPSKIQDNGVKYTFVHGGYGYFVTFLYFNGAVIEFNVMSDIAVSDATITFKLATEGGASFTLAPNGDVEGETSGTNPRKYEIELNGKKLNYNPIVLSDNKGFPFVMPFTEYTIAVNASLVAGKNTIRLITSNNISAGGTTRSTAPVIDCMKIVTGAELSWTPKYENLVFALGDDWWL